MHSKWYRLLELGLLATFVFCQSQSAYAASNQPHQQQTISFIYASKSADTLGKTLSTLQLDETHIQAQLPDGRRVSPLSSRSHVISWQFERHASSAGLAALSANMSESESAISTESTSPRPPPSNPPITAPAQPGDTLTWTYRNGDYIITATYTCQQLPDGSYDWVLTQLNEKYGPIYSKQK